MRTFRTVLEQRIWERRLTLEEFVEEAELYAREHREPGTLGLRHLQRLVAGRRSADEPLGQVKASTARLLESMFGSTVEVLLSPPMEGSPGGSSVGISAHPGLAGAFEWLDGAAGWLSGSAAAKVSAGLKVADVGMFQGQRARRSRISRQQIADAVRRYYRVNDTFGVRGLGLDVQTSVFTRSEWSGLGLPLDAGNERLALVQGDGAAPVLSAGCAEAAVQRLVMAAALGVRFANLPLYRLAEIDVSARGIGGAVDVGSFVEYALTMDLLEAELADAVVSGSKALNPLRDRYLPDMDAVVDVAGRVCAGGVLSLVAIARPADPFRGAADYALIVQTRSDQVVNAAGKLAVIPKGFHQPLTDPRADVRIGATLRRELEEELFGRDDVDVTAGASRAASPMHPGRWSAPMRWLEDEPGRMRMECTGFGLNLVSGNYEFATLVVVEDEEFWPRFGGQLEANWEASGLTLYSSLDGELITDLVQQEAWSNEGLFALLQGLRRLREIGGSRVSLPSFEVSGL
ncbi:transcriptional regulator [Lentzea sp. NBC_00516]|uniref:transcriptional regulator n=1 Tax=Lentzea sp. NBC_00516 TaxID=2903582 RepID=UPI002E810D15|nr:transcriptional regulator [Lentzea sp. NBC_00516]WUD26485.1 transcriptional regulator [Lentzea sp. NBC_00516]